MELGLDWYWGLIFVTAGVYWEGAVLVSFFIDFVGGSEVRVI